MRIRRRRRARPLARLERFVTDERRDLGEGAVLIEAGIVARLFGIRLLRLDADVVLTPARAGDPPDGSDGTPHDQELVNLFGHTPPATPSGSSQLLPERHSLSEARLLLQQSEESLAQARRSQ